MKVGADEHSTALTRQRVPRREEAQGRERERQLIGRGHLNLRQEGQEVNGRDRDTRPFTSSGE